MPARDVRFATTGKYDELIAAYGEMARDGFRTGSGREVAGGYQRQEAMRFRAHLKPLFAAHGVSSVLDYGAGGGDWREKRTPEGPTLAEYLNVEDYRVFEPARDADQRAPADAAVCFDVMEHVFLADVPYVLADVFACARRLAVFNIACYPADARLPNGENAHITLRPPNWWRGAIDMFAAAHPEVETVVYASTTYRDVRALPRIRMAEVAAAQGYVREDRLRAPAGRTTSAGEDEEER